MRIKLHLLLFAEAASDDAQRESAEGCPAAINHPVLNRLARNNKTGVPLQVQFVRGFGYRAEDQIIEYLRPFARALSAIARVVR
jgi:hypothetical protein